MNHRFLRAVVVAIAIFSALQVQAQQPYEGPADFKAADLLPPALVKGAHFTVADQVRTEGYYHEFVVESDFGSIPAVGTSMLYVRLGEVRALAALQEVSKSDVFISAAGNSVLSVGKTVGQAVTDPKATVAGLGAGAKRYGENLGRKAKKTAETATDAVAGDDKPKTDTTGEKSTTDKAVDTGTAVAKSYFGVSGSARRWAQKLGVDPYTSNAVLRKSLEEIGKIDAAGEIEAEFFTESAEMLATLHAGDPVKAVLTDSRAMVAVAGGKKAVALLPLDSVRWTEASKKALTDIADRARKELSAGILRIDLTGRMSPRALKEAEAIGWSVSQRVPGPVVP